MSLLFDHLNLVLQGLNIVDYLIQQASLSCNLLNHAKNGHGVDISMYDLISIKKFT